MENNRQISGLDQDKRDQWFANFIDQIKVDHLMLCSNIAPKEIVNMYNAFINDDKESMTKFAWDVRKDSSMHLIKAIVLEYITELNKTKRKPCKLALGLYDSKIYVWAEIKDGDEEVEDSILLTEATINEKYIESGFYLTSTIVEESEKIPIPNHYQEVPWRHSKTT